MLRRSASQVFGDTTPQKQWAAANSSMFSFLPPSRPQYQNTELSSSLLTAELPQLSTSAPAPSLDNNTTSPPPPMFPRNQIEAMPPSEETSQVEMEAAWDELATTLVLDSSTRHPVFFTERLKRVPNGVDAGAWISPVAAGYVFEEDDLCRREELARL
ncbi:hypothetical protein B7463_g9737, partial [Scytalidium lignicola]